MSDKLSRAAKRIGWDKSVQLAESDARTHYRDAETQHRLRREQEALVAALRYELSITRSAMGERTNAGTIEELVRVRLRVSELETAISHHFSRDPTRSSLHPWDAALYEAAEINHGLPTHKFTPHYREDSPDD